METLLRSRAKQAGPLLMVGLGLLGLGLLSIKTTMLPGHEEPSGVAAGPQQAPQQQEPLAQLQHSFFQATDDRIRWSGRAVRDEALFRSVRSLEGVGGDYLWRHRWEDCHCSQRARVIYDDM
jgi:hypothetical protein